MAHKAGDCRSEGPTQVKITIVDILPQLPSVVIILNGFSLRATAEQAGPIPLVEDSQHHNTEPNDPKQQREVCAPLKRVKHKTGNIGIKPDGAKYQIDNLAEA